MFYQFFSPHPALKEIVNNIMISRIQFNPQYPRASFLFPPLPEQCLFFYPADKMQVRYDHTSVENLDASVIVGPQTSPLQIIMGYHHVVVKVGFQPGGLYRLLGIPMQQLLRTEAFDAHELLGPGVNHVGEQLSETASFVEMKQVVEAFLLRSLKNVKMRLPIDSVLQLMIKEGGSLRIDKAASLSCLSNRQFERVFKQRLGLSPKFFSRLVRFANAWTIKELNPETPWIEIAHRCDYFDQMHLVRDFKEFARTNPSDIEAALLQSPITLHNKLFY